MWIKGRTIAEERMKNYRVQNLSTEVVSSSQQVLKFEVSGFGFVNKGDFRVIRPIHPISSTILFI